MSKVQAYIPWIDVLRAVAVILACMCHLLPGVYGPTFAQGSYGVDLFFVISGFLITLILLRRRDMIAKGERLREVGAFFTRRILRLWPAYYFCLVSFILLWLLYDYAGQWEPSRQPGNLSWFVFQVTNIYQFLNGLNASLFNHFWSLSVEEQFYLIWPWLLLFLPKRSILPVFVSLLVIGLCAQLFFPGDHSRLFDGTPGDARLLPIGNFHTLAMGAIVAWIVHVRRDLFDRFSKLFLPLGLIALGLFVLIEWMSPPVIITAWDIPQRLLLAIGCGGLIGAAYAAGRTRFPRWLRPVAKLGKISYGVYLYHKIVPYVLMPVLGKLHLSPGVWVDVLICFVITVIWAALSYRYLEAPILRFRKAVVLRKAAAVAES